MPTLGTKDTISNMEQSELRINAAITSIQPFIIKPRYGNEDPVFSTTKMYTDDDVF